MPYRTANKNGAFMPNQLNFESYLISLQNKDSKKNQEQFLIRKEILLKKRLPGNGLLYYLSSYVSRITAVFYKELIPKERSASMSVKENLA